MIYDEDATLRAWENDPVNRVLQEVGTELKKARAKHPNFTTTHHGYAVILEELDELWDHVKADTATGSEARKECLQIAAMALRFIIDLEVK